MQVFDAHMEDAQLEQLWVQARAVIRRAGGRRPHSDLSVITLCHSDSQRDPVGRRFTRWHATTNFSGGGHHEPCGGGRKRFCGTIADRTGCRPWNQLCPWQESGPTGIRCDTHVCDCGDHAASSGVQLCRRWLPNARYDAADCTCDAARIGIPCIDASGGRCCTVERIGAPALVGRICNANGRSTR